MDFSQIAFLAPGLLLLVGQILVTVAHSMLSDQSARNSAKTLADAEVMKTHGPDR
jgi:hypothetical protein